jgi:hypothetical protein
MWVPSGVVLILIGIWLFFRWLTASEQCLRHGVLGDLIVQGEERA